jgi:hypothetical protein
MVDAKAIGRMAALFRVAAAAAGLEQADVEAGPESVGLVGTGVDIVFARNAMGRGKEGWQVRVTYHLAELGATTGRMNTEIAGSYEAADIFHAARQAVMLVVQKRVEAALEAAV